MLANLVVACILIAVLWTKGSDIGTRKTESDELYDWTIEYFKIEPEKDLKNIKLMVLISDKEYKKLKNETHKKLLKEPKNEEIA